VQAIRDYLMLKLGDRDFETFCCLFLDSRHRLIEFVELFRGTIDGALYLVRRLSTALKRL
jgi:DNA repair protein RadC